MLRDWVCSDLYVNAMYSERQMIRFTCSMYNVFVVYLLLELVNKLWYGLVKIFYQTKIRHLEDRRIGVLQRNQTSLDAYQKGLTLLMATMSFESFIPARCWMAPEIPIATYNSGATTLPVCPTCKELSA